MLQRRFSNDCWLNFSSTNIHQKVQNKRFHNTIAVSVFKGFAGTKMNNILFQGDEIGISKCKYRKFDCKISCDVATK